MTTLTLRRDTPKTERLVIKIWQPDKVALERIAEAEGESVAVIARRIIRRAVREYMAANSVETPPATAPGPSELAAHAAEKEAANALATA